MRVRVFVAGAAILIGGFSSAVRAPDVGAYEEYKPGCMACHGDFLAAPYTSLADGQTWTGGLHAVHQQMVTFDCATCHRGAPGATTCQGGTNDTLPCTVASDCPSGTCAVKRVRLNLADGGQGFDPIGCIGCHGRVADRFASVPKIKGDGAGLRQHHWAGGIVECLLCHDRDSAPDLYTPASESVLPPFYFTPDAAHPTKPTDPCNRFGEEDVAGSPIGLDNDGNDAYDTADPACPLVATATPTPTATPSATPTPAPGTATPTVAPTATPVLEGPDHLVLYKAKAAKDGGLFPRQDYNLQLDDVRLDNSELDDPENYQVRKEKSLGVPARKNAEPGPAQPALHYIRYQIKEAKEGAGAFDAQAGRYPPAVKHQQGRVWELENQFGTINVTTRKVESLLVPASKDLLAPPGAPADATHYICYQAKPMRDDTDQTPGGLARKDLQAFFGDQFLDVDCARDTFGNVSFPHTSVEGRCLLDLRKVQALCNPVIKSDVGGSRVTIAPPDSVSIPSSSKSLLCYQAKVAKKILGPEAAALAELLLGTPLQQSKHLKREPYTTPGNQLPAPLRMTTKKVELVCVPTTVVEERAVNKGDPVLPAAAGFVGSETCATCHPEQFDGWVETLHRMPLRNTNEPGRTGKAVVADSNGDGTDDFRAGVDLGTAPNAAPFAVYGAHAPVLGFDPGRTDPNSGAPGVYTITIGPITYDVTRTHGGHGYWKQQYQTRIGDSYYYLPVQYNEATNEYVPYHPERWYDGSNLPLLTNPATLASDIDKATSFERNCAGCHNTGLDVAVDSAGQYVTGYVELGVGCERCHGPGEQHAVSMDADDIVNPGKFGPCDGDVTAGDGIKDGTCRESGAPCDAPDLGFPANAPDCLASADELCGSCHSRGASTLVLDGRTLGYPAKDDGLGGFQGFLPGSALADFYNLTSAPDSHWGYEQVYGGDGHLATSTDARVASRRHEQQYLDLLIGPHAPNNFYDPTCFSCHTSHGSSNAHNIVDSLEEDGITVPTRVEDNSLCLACHATHGPFAGITPAQVAQIGTGATPAEVAAAVMSHVAAQAGMGGAYDPEGAGLGRCTSCHLPKLATSAVTGVDAEGHTTGDVTTHVFSIVWPSVNERLTGGDEAMSNSCTGCHNTTTPIAMDDELFEWAKSGHADVTARHWRYSAGPERTACVQCHSGYGFVDFLAGIPEADRRTEPKMHSCYTCHDGQPGDLHAVRSVASVTFPSGAVVTTGGNSKICMNCHAARQSGAGVDAYLLTHPDPSPISFGSVNPHYLPAAATYFGSLVSGPYEYATKAYLGTTPHAGFTGKQCVDCHLSRTLGADEVGGHTMAMAHAGEENTAACTGCHNPATQPGLARYRNPFAPPVDYDGDLDTTEGIAGEVQTLMDDLLAALAAAGVTCSDAYPYCSGWNGTTAQQQSQLKAAYNYRFLHSDPGAYAHNGLYAIQLLHDSFEDLTGAAHAGTRP